MRVKLGYKQTEVGVIPEEWNAVPMEAIATRIGDGLHGTPVYSSNGEYFFINGNNLQDGKIVVTSETKTLSHSEFVKHQKPLSDRSILMSINGTIGNLALFDGEAIVLGKSAAYVNIRKEISTRFVYHSLQTETVRRQFLDGMTGSTIGNLGLATIRRTQVPLPPTEAERRAVAEALSDVDELLDGLDRLIAKKRDLKQAANQKLLTGQTRLPGFHGEWGRKTLKHIVKTPITDGPHLTPRFLDDGIPFLSVNNLADGKLDLRDLRFVSREDHELFSLKCKPQRDDILLGKAASVGKVAIVDFSFEFNIWSPIAMIRVSSEHAPRFVYYQLQGAEVSNQISLLTNSSSQGNIGMGDIEKIIVRLPDRAEQEAIAEVLTEMDAELTALEQRREKTRALKLAMMQELLTGRTRLVSAKAANA
jgi:type I restriction enzyme S subunit